MIKPSVSVIGAEKAMLAVGSLMKKLEGNTSVLVGVQKGSGTYEDGTPIAVIAASNHFGTDKIPARPFLDKAIEQNKKKYSKIMEHGSVATLNEKSSMPDTLNKIGLAASGDVQEFMAELSSPANAPSTISAKKGQDNPLIDKGHLRQSIRHQIAMEPVEEGLE